MGMKYRDPSTGQLKELSLKAADTLPIGSVIAYSGSNEPSGWLICDGRAISRTSYSNLFNVIGTTYGAGDGSTTFNLPDYRDRVPVGLDSNDSDFNTLGKTGGSKYLQKHNHTLTIFNQYSNGTGGSYAASKKVGKTTDAADGGASCDGINMAGTGDSGNLQPYIVTNYIIKAEKSVGVLGKILNIFSNSDKDTYSCKYIDNNFLGKMKILWQNPNPNNEMAAGYEIILNSSDYDFIIWIAKYANDNEYNFSSISYKGHGCLISTIGAVSGNMVRRSLDYVNDTKYTAAVGYNGAAEAQNKVALPIMAVGIKL